MKILIIGPIPTNLGGKDYGGVCTHISGLSQELHKKGNKVVLWNHKPFKSNSQNSIEIIENSLGSYLKAMVFGVFNFSSYDISYLSFKYKLLFIYQVYRLKKILKENPFDIIHVHSLNNTISIALQQVQNNTPHIITDHGFWNNQAASDNMNSVFKRNMKSIEGCSSLIFISEFAKSKHSEVDFGQKKKLVKIKNPLYIPDKVFLKKKGSLIKTIFFNGLTESVKIKNLPILLNAIENDSYLNNIIKLIVITNEEGRNYINQRIYSFEIKIYGKTQWEKVVELYKASDLLVVPSKSDSFGLVYLEALMYGVPIIGLDRLINEFQYDLKTYIGEGFDSNLQSHHDLAIKITKVLNTKSFDIEIVHSQLKNIYSWENNVNNYIALYKKVILNNE